MDAQLTPAEGKSIVASASAAVLTSILYFPKGVNHKGSAASPSPWSNGKNYLHIRVEDTALAGSGGAAGCTISLKNKASASSMGSGTTLISKALASISASGTNFPDGKNVWDLPLPPGQILPYVCLHFLATTKKIKAGKVTAWIDQVPTQS